MSGTRFPTFPGKKPLSCHGCNGIFSYIRWCNGSIGCFCIKQHIHLCVSCTKYLWKLPYKKQMTEKAELIYGNKTCLLWSSWREFSEEECANSVTFLVISFKLLLIFVLDCAAFLRRKALTGYDGFNWVSFETNYTCILCFYMRLQRASCSPGK